MKAFTSLFEALDTTTSTNAKVAAMAAYFRTVPAGDAAWAVSFLIGRKIKRLVSTADMRRWAGEVAGVEPWLYEECYAEVGDSAETISLLVSRPEASSDDTPLARWVEDRLLTLRGMDEAAQREVVTGWWSGLARDQVFLLCKLMTGAFRVGVSRTLVVRALAEVSGLPPTDIERRLMGSWVPSAGAFEALISAEAAHASTTDAGLSAPYPFFLASPLETDPSELGDLSEWAAEWKWDGIRGQLVRRGGRAFLWSRGEELVTERFPEIIAEAARLPDGCVLDGEILVWKPGAAQPSGFQSLQKRLGRVTVPDTLLRDAPAVFVAYDLLEGRGDDLRSLALRERRARLMELMERVPASGRLRLSPTVAAESWAQLAESRSDSRARGVEGLMLKRLDSPYGAGRRVGDWWKWKIAPLSVDAVLIYAQSGSGKRANLLTDYTFAVWDRPVGEPGGAAPQLVPFAKAYSGLTNDEIVEVDRWVRNHTVERFGPVRLVEPVLVFELGFEGIGPSTRHRSGVAVRFPRMLRRRFDKTAAEADTLLTLRDLARAASSDGSHAAR